MAAEHIEQSASLTPQASHGNKRAALAETSAERTLQDILECTDETGDEQSEEWAGTCLSLLDLSFAPVSEFPLLLRPSVRLLLRKTPFLIPLSNLTKIIDAVMKMGRRTHNRGLDKGTPASGRLIVGRQGIGKSSVLCALAEPGVLHEMMKLEHETSAAGPTFDESVLHTVVLYGDVKLHKPEHDNCFTDWMLNMLLASKTGRGSELTFPENSTIRKQLTQRWPKGVESQFGKPSALQLASDCLRTLSIRAVCILDDIEYLFNAAHFTRETAGRWYNQLFEFDGLKKPGISMVLCASLQRARQLFLRGPSEPEPKFGGLLKHAKDLSGNWNGTKFKAVHVDLPAWTAFSLAWFLLRCSVVNEDVATHKGHAKKLDECLAALSNAERADAEETVTHCDHVQFGLLCVVRMFGDGPRDVQDGMDGLLLAHGNRSRVIPTNFVQSTVPSPARFALHAVLGLLAKNGVVAPLLSEGSGGHAGAAPTAAAAHSAAGTEKSFPGRQFLLGFEPSQLQVDYNELFQRMKLSGAILELKGDSADTKATLALNSAIDAGLLQEASVASNGSRIIQLCSPLSVWNAYAPLVHPKVLDWFKFPGYGARRELPMARALARLHSTASPTRESPRAQRFINFFSQARSSVLIRTSSSSEPSTVVESNDDGQIGDLASMRPIFPHNATASDVSSAFPGIGTFEQAKTFVQSVHAAADEPSNLLDQTLCAYMSVHALHDEVIDCLQRGLTPSVWVKELPDSAGADLIGICVDMHSATDTCVKIVRVQVKTGEPSSLDGLRGGQPAWQAVDKAVHRFTGQSAAAAAVVGASNGVLQQHADVVAAIARTVFGAIQGKRPDGDDVLEHYAEFVEGVSAMQHAARVESLACLATTHLPSAASVSNLDRCNILLLDACDLRSSWGALGQLGRFHRIRPFFGLPSPPSSRISSPSSGQQLTPAQKFKQSSLKRRAKQRSPTTSAAAQSPSHPAGTAVPAAPAPADLQPLADTAIGRFRLLQLASGKIVQLPSSGLRISPQTLGLMQPGAIAPLTSVRLSETASEDGTQRLVVQRAAMGDARFLRRADAVERGILASASVRCFEDLKKDMPHIWTAAEDYQVSMDSAVQLAAGDLLLLSPAQGGVFIIDDRSVSRGTKRPRSEEQARMSDISRSALSGVG